MLYTILESFSPGCKEWNSYIKWRGINFKSFDSIDGMLRETLFDTPQTDEEWAYVVNESCMIHLIIDFQFALKKLNELGKGELIGLKLDNHDENSPNFLGFDLIDGHYHVSLLTNWGNDIEIINQSLQDNALVKDFGIITKIYNHVKSSHPNDGHVRGCKIISVYDITPKTN